MSGYSENVLSDGWATRKDECGRIFYTHLASGQTSWEQPSQMSRSVEYLPQGWAAYQDQDGRTFYANALIGTSSWLPPAEVSSSAQINNASSMSNEELILLVDRLTEDAFLGFINKFLNKNAFYFDQEEEHKHDYYKIHQSYQRFFESRVEAFLRERGQTPETFALAASCGGLAEDVAEELLAVSDYETFVTLMRNRRVTLLAAAHD